MFCAHVLNQVQVACIMHEVEEGGANSVGHIRALCIVVGVG